MKVNAPTSTQSLEYDAIGWAGRAGVESDNPTRTIGVRYDPIDNVATSTDAENKIMF